ncbi:MAG: hypothetical protein BWY83_02857 [bacterium ADurb.Bin478]|nr:MAG: hypothetical protein BWY83_02857 [bacterium ADurb.Bin478]
MPDIQNACATMLAKKSQWTKSPACTAPNNPASTMVSQSGEPGRSSRLFSAMAHARPLPTMIQTGLLK